MWPNSPWGWDCGIAIFHIAMFLWFFIVFCHVRSKSKLVKKGGFWQKDIIPSEKVSRPLKVLLLPLKLSLCLIICSYYQPSLAMPGVPVIGPKQVQNGRGKERKKHKTCESKKKCEGRRCSQLPWAAIQASKPNTFKRQKLLFLLPKQMEKIGQRFSIFLCTKSTSGKPFKNVDSQTVSPESPIHWFAGWSH